MPFTISHAVLAPPISKLTGHALPVAALAIGCMVPDLYRLFTQENSNTSIYGHQLFTPTYGLAWVFVYFGI